MGEGGEKEILNSQLENIPNVDKVQIIAFLMLNYIYLLPAQQMRVLHTQTQETSSKNCLKPPSQLPSTALSPTSPKLHWLRCLETGAPSKSCLSWGDETDEVSSSLSSNHSCQGALLGCRQLKPWKRGKVLSRLPDRMVPMLSQVEQGLVRVSTSLLSGGKWEANQAEALSHSINLKLAQSSW